MNIKIYDNFLSKEEILKLDNILWNSPYILNCYSDKKPEKMDRDWALSMEVTKENKNYDFYKDIEKRIVDLVNDGNNDDYICYKIHVNANKFGDVLDLHRDVNPVKGLVPLTSMIYGNKEWDINWGGETIFSDGEEILKSVTPKPGRLIIFDATILHTGRVPSPAFPNFRYTLVYRLISDIKEKTII
jgi:SM-20-related protein